MPAEQVEREMAEHMKRTIDVLKEHLAKVQTGRANPAMVEDVVVEYYGTRMPLKQLATIAAPDANLLVVQPYDKSQMASVEKAILAADLGLNPAGDGNVLRIKVPKLSEERRRELSKVIKSRGEETKVALRNIRRDANEKLDAMKKSGEISEDDHRHYREKTDGLVHEHSKTVDTLVDQKSKQIQTI
jgi:ribosome recycling factor